MPPKPMPWRTPSSWSSPACSPKPPGSRSRFSFPNHELSSRKSQAFEIDDEDSLPSEWLTHKTTSQSDKTAIKEALKASHLIPGVQLISRRSWRIH